MPESHNPKSAIPNRENPQSEIPNQRLLRLFVYGTLKKGFWNHDRFCTRAISIEPATTWGRLYHLPAGFPALEVPESRILATGTADPLADTRTQNTIELPENAMPQPEGDWDLVHGELMTFANPGFDLPPIDRLEAFNPNGRCIYKRVLVVVSSENQIRPAWLYTMQPAENMPVNRIPSVWNGEKIMEM